MKILHICSGYPDTKLYQNLLRELDNKNIDQTMYVPYKTSEISNKRILDNAKHTEYIFSSPYTKLDRILYYPKINKILKDLKMRVDFRKVELIHAHFLFSNGGIAYKLKKEIGIDYIVAVRNTDINYFFKYAIHLRSLGIKILASAKKVVFLSPAYKSFLLDNYIPNHLKDEIHQKSVVIPNGVDNFWLENINVNKQEYNEENNIRLIFIGELNNNKNVKSSIRAVTILKDKGYRVKFDIIGSGADEDELKILIKETNNQDSIKLHGFIEDKNLLIRLLRKAHVFIMPSYNETFGLVYIEAMTQGLPVIYSKGQGIDGYFREGQVGFSVSPDNTEEIAFKIQSILKDYNKIYINAINAVNKFEWSKIANEYIELYNE
ncbi:glycosyltransferase family 4 protein [Sediminibacillus halophilus]|uniref:Glycosyltransferase involved in cell wall bisynthesis n=1 Tax=Sediminibacillus halophilus TaxID=482461 RepID=A0A1G9U9G5_9BACI|nr:glycosyltransferase family 4 protein [Sediminibacillus halophilus]SDM56591.1 Glycosyltransferase involved in cell wall bisynthesis [Sediminibacillus halophilus]